MYLKQWKQLILLRNVAKKINWHWTTKNTLWQTVEQAWNHEFWQSTCTFYVNSDEKVNPFLYKLKTAVQTLTRVGIHSLRYWACIRSSDNEYVLYFLTRLNAIIHASIFSYTLFLAYANQEPCIVICFVQEKKHPWFVFITKNIKDHNWFLFISIYHIDVNIFVANKHSKDPVWFDRSSDSFLWCSFNESQCTKQLDTGAR